MFIPLPLLVLIISLWIFEDDLRLYIGRKLIRKKYNSVLPKKAVDDCGFYNELIKAERKQVPEFN